MRHTVPGLNCEIYCSSQGNKVCFSVINNFHLLIFCWKKKKKIYFILLEINATSCVITEWPPFLHKLLWALRRFWKQKKPAFVFIIILIFIVILVIIIIWRFAWVTFTKNVCEAKTAEMKKKSLNITTLL